MSQHYRFINIRNNKLELEKFIDDTKINHNLIIEPFSYEFTFIHSMKHNNSNYLTNNINNNYKYIMDNKIIQIDLTDDLNTLSKKSYLKIKDNSLNSFVLLNVYHSNIIDTDLITIQNKKNIIYQTNNGFNVINNYINEDCLIFIDLPQKYDFTNIEMFKDIKNKNYIAKLIFVIPKYSNIINYINGNILYELETYGSKIFSHLIISNY